MKKVNLILLLFLLGFTTTIKAQDPAITMTTAKSTGETITFFLSASADNTTIQVDFGDGVKVDKVIDMSSTYIIQSIAGATIKIYGNGFTSLGCASQKITALDISKCTGLTLLYCYGNQLSSLNVTNNTLLTRLLCSDNPLTTLDISKNTALTHLECGNNQLTTLDVTNNTALIKLTCIINQLTALDLSKNVALTEFYCYSNKLTSMDFSNNKDLKIFYCYSNKLASLDMTNNTALTDLDCNSNLITSLNVTKNVALTKLNCNTNQLTTLDLSNNTALTNLECTYNQLAVLNLSANTALTSAICNSNLLTTLDVSNNKALNYLSCTLNKLNALDVSNNTALKTFYCGGNLLSALDVSKNTALTSFNCVSNRLLFASLPIKQGTWTYYKYAPQSPLELEKNLNTGVELNLSSQYLINGNTTTYTWKTKSGTTLVAGVDYTITNGRTTFINAKSDSVYCEMTNATFPNFTAADVLKTTCIKVNQPTGIKDLNPSLSIYAYQKALYVNLPYNAEISVFDLRGRQIASQRALKGENILHMSNPGIYTVKIKGNNATFSRKVIVK